MRKTAILLALVAFISATSFAQQMPGWKKIEPSEIADNAYRLFNTDWMALAAGVEGDMNAMTISSGSFGSHWKRPIITVYVSPDRYTHSFMERNDYFTVTAFPEEFRDKLSYLGSHSGRDGDKIKDAGLTVAFTDLGNPTFPQGRLVIECKKIYGAQLDSARYGSEIKDVYGNLGVHYQYVGEIVNVWIKENLAK